MGEREFGDRFRVGEQGFGNRLRGGELGWKTGSGVGEQRFDLDP